MTALAGAPASGVPPAAAAAGRHRSGRGPGAGSPLEHLPVVGHPIEAADHWLDGVRRRGHHGSLRDRDPAFIERLSRWLGPVCDFYFRGEVRHLDRIPATGPVLLVGNHSGGLMTPDTWVFEVNYVRHFGTRRAVYALAHDMVLGFPLLGTWLRRQGSLPASHQSALTALAGGAALLVYPGGDEDVFRSFRDRNRIHLAGRTGFVRLALEAGVPLVPVVGVGGHETCLVLNDGGRLASRLGLGRFRLKTLPIVVAPPWGISPGDWLLHLPLPARITVDCGTPIDLRAHLRRTLPGVPPGDQRAVRECYRHVERRMQAMLDRLAAERRLPVLG